MGADLTDFRQLFFLSAFLLLGVAAPVAVLISYDSNFEVNHLLAFAMTSISAFFLSKNLAQPNYLMNDFVLWVFVYIWMGLAPLVQLNLGTYPTTTPNPPLDQVPYSYFIIAVGLAGYLMSKKFLGSKQREKSKQPTGEPTFPLQKQNSFLLWVCSTVAFLLYVQIVGWQTIFTFRIERATYLSSFVEDSFTREFLYSICWTFSLIAATSKLSEMSGRSNFRDWLQAFTFALPSLVIANPISTGRYIFGCVYGALLLQAFASFTRLSPRTLKIGLIGGLVTIFPALNFFRSASSAASNPVSLEYLTTGDFDAFAQVLNALDLVWEKGEIFSTQFLGPLGFFIPRSIWPDKPLDTGRVIGNFQGYSFTNLSAPLWAEALISFSFVGVFIVFLLLGIYSFRSDLTLNNERGLVPGGSYFPLALYLLIVLRGSLLQATAALVFLLLASGLAKLVSGNPEIVRSKKAAGRNFRFR